MGSDSHLPLRSQRSKARESSIETAKQRVILLLDLDCFYAQCERIRLGFTGTDDHSACAIALLQWNSCLAVSYPARAFGIKRGDGFDVVHSKSGGKCIAVHVPVLETAANAQAMVDTKDFDDRYESVYQTTQEDQQRMRAQDIGRRRYPTEGKACLERYRVASRRIFELVMQCLQISANKPQRGVVLEKASIDEFFLDVTGVCNSPEHPLWKTVDMHKSRSGEEGTSQHTTVVLGSNDEESRDMVRGFPDLERGCQLAHYIRQTVFQELGFTLSAGISVNKMTAKLAAAYGKPNGQVVVPVDQVAALMDTTNLNKVRNFGGKLGKAIIEMLPTETPPTMGSVSKYLSLPILRDHFCAETARMIFDASRGHDEEPVKAKNSGNVVKSITAFKSLPRSLDADIEEAALIKWLHLLVQEVCSRVETDALRNHRYPRNCTIHYGICGKITESGKLDMRSFRIPFPPQRLSITQRISRLMEKMTAMIIAREAEPISSKKGYSCRKPLRLVRIGVCATEMKEVCKHESIADYFSASKSPVKPVRSCVKSRAAQQLQRGVATKSCDNDESPDEDLVANDHEDQSLDLLDEVAATNSQVAEKAVASTQQAGPAARVELHVANTEALDLQLAKKLQASYDRENSILGEFEARKRRISQDTASRPSRCGPQQGKKTVKCRKISAFFAAANN